MSWNSSATGSNQKGMTSPDMAIQDQNGVTRSNTVLPISNQVPLDVNSNCVEDTQMKDQSPPGNDYAPKVRKPYTITKQRERWTEDEHKKFIEALKLYGRAWRRIEEHVGTKTAVQIRSHAQKYFSKVVRDSSANDASSVKPVEIPPPRPKRKPLHPYPRKLVAPLKAGTLVAEGPRRSPSPNLSASEQENRSPTSVLSGIGSEILGTPDSTTPSGSPSQGSSAADMRPGVSLYSDPNPSPDVTGSPLLVQLPAPDEQVPVKLELFPQDSNVVQERPAEAASTRCLKLFGKTLLVTDSHRPSSPTMGTCKSSPSNMNDGLALHLNLMPQEFSSQGLESIWHPSKCVAPADVYYMQYPRDSSEDGSGQSVLYGGIQFPHFPLCSTIATEARSSSVSGLTQDREVQKEGSWTGSNTGSVNAGGNGDKNWEMESQSCQNPVDKEGEQQPELMYKPNKASSKEQRASPDKYLKGFLPYKRCLSERETQSSVTREERKEQRICLFL